MGARVVARTSSHGRAAKSRPCWQQVAARLASVSQVVLPRIDLLPRAEPGNEWRFTLSVGDGGKRQALQFATHVRGVGIGQADALNEQDDENVFLRVDPSLGAEGPTVAVGAR